MATKHIPKWQKKLTRFQREHLQDTTENPRPTLKGFKWNRSEQIRLGIECRECESIARALGIESEVSR